MAGGSAAAALRVVHGGHEPNVVLLYRLARHSPGAQRRAARIAAAAPAAPLCVAALLGGMPALLNTTAPFASRLLLLLQLANVY